MVVKLRNSSIILSCLLATISASAGDPAVVTQAPLSPVLVSLDQKLTAAQKDREQGEITPEEYRSLLVGFRLNLNGFKPRVPPVHADTALHARLLARLGESGQAAANLQQALDREPENEELRLALGQLRYDARDYSAALAEANAVLERHPANRAALALKHSSQGRAASVNTAETAAPTTRTIERTVSAGPSAPSSEVNRIIAAANATPRARTPVRIAPSSGIDSFQLSGDSVAAPEATLWDRIVAMATPDDRLIDEDISLLRAKAGNFDLPADILSMATTSPEVPRQFAQWLKTMKPEDLPPIEYGIVGPGDFAEYKKGLGRGKIVMSHFIRNAEPEARATALMHEVFHYWDMKVAKNAYQTETYGFTSPENSADREYDPYLLTGLFWKHVRPSSAASALSKNLDRFPTDPEEVRRKVDAIEAQRRSKRE